MPLVISLAAQQKILLCQPFVGSIKDTDCPPWHVNKDDRQVLFQEIKKGQVYEMFTERFGSFFSCGFVLPKKRILIFPHSEIVLEENNNGQTYFKLVAKDFQSKEIELSQKLLQKLVVTLFDEKGLLDEEETEPLLGGYQPIVRKEDTYLISADLFSRKINKKEVPFLEWMMDVYTNSENNTFGRPLRAACNNIKIQSEAALSYLLSRDETAQFYQMVKKVAIPEVVARMVELSMGYQQAKEVMQKIPGEEYARITDIYKEIMELHDNGKARTVKVEKDDGKSFAFDTWNSPKYISPLGLIYWQSGIVNQFVPWSAVETVKAGNKIIYRRKRT